jgi:group I intron endonuclease
VPLTQPNSLMEKNMFNIYSYTNLLSGKLYVGQTCQKLERYFRNDVTRSLLGDNRKPHLYNALRKYGAENFRADLLAIATDKVEADAAEQFLIKILATQNNQIGYNIAAGGSGSFGYKRVITEEQREKYRVTSTGRKHSEETKAKISAANKGKSKSTEHREKLSEAKKGIKLGPRSAEVRKRMSEAGMGHLVSEETRKKMSVSVKAYHARVKEEKERGVHVGNG